MSIIYKFLFKTGLFICVIKVNNFYLILGECYVGAFGYYENVFRLDHSELSQL